MRNLHTLDGYRMMQAEQNIYGVSGDSTCGCFAMPSPIDGQSLKIVASSGQGWDHVSVSRSSRCPNWIELEFVKRKFFNDDETAMQLHIPSSEHINLHPHTLHLWRPQQGDIPRPPQEFV